MEMEENFKLVIDVNYFSACSMDKSTREELIKEIESKINETDSESSSGFFVVSIEEVK